MIQQRLDAIEERKRKKSIAFCRASYPDFAELLSTSPIRVIAETALEALPKSAANEILSNYE